MNEKIAKKLGKGKGKLGGSTEGETNEDYVLRYVLACRDEAEEARRKRMDLNRNNYNMYHLEHDFSDKRAGQSTEVLPKEKMAVEQTKSFFQQALADIGDWWRVVRFDGKQDNPNDIISGGEVYALTNYMLKQARYFDHIGDTVWYALLGSLGITQVTGKLKSKPKYVARKVGKGENYKKILEMTEDKTWELCLKEIRQVNYYPDPTGNGLYEITEEFTDKCHVLACAEGDYAIYDKEEVEELGNANFMDEDTGNGGPTKDEETNQNPESGSLRPRVKLTRFYGNIVSETTGKLLYENVFVTVANDTCIIQKPTQNPFWHQESDIVAAPLITVPGSVWHTALMDSPAKLNSAMTELFNLMLDAGFSSVHGIKQLRVDWLEDISQVSDGIKPGDTLKVNNQAPPGGKVIEDAIVGQFPQQVFNVANLLQQEYNASALTSDLRGGITPMRSQSATAVVEQGNTITSVFQGIAKNLEINKVQPELTKAWQTIAQNWDLIDKDIFVTLFGAERGEQLSQLDPEDVFAATVSGMKFEVYGISLTINQKLEYQKYMTLLQSVGASPMFTEAFLAQFDPAKVMAEIISTLGIDKKRIQIDQPAGGAAPAQQAPPAPAGPDQMSQIPQAGAESLASILGGTQQTTGGPQPAEGQVG